MSGQHELMQLEQDNALSLDELRKMYSVPPPPLGVGGIVGGIVDARPAYLDSDDAAESNQEGDEGDDGEEGEEGEEEEEGDEGEEEEESDESDEEDDDFVDSSDGEDDESTMADEEQMGEQHGK